MSTMEGLGRKRAATLCDLLSAGANHLRSGGPGPSPQLLERARSYGRGFAEQGYPAESLVLVAVRELPDRLALAFGAWWVGHRVGFGWLADHRRRDDLAVSVGAALQVCDPQDVVDEEHLRHRDVPAVAPSDLALPAARWPARCRPEDVAIELPDPGGGQTLHRYLHAELAARAREMVAGRPAGRSAGAEVEPPCDVVVAELVRAAACALVPGPPGEPAR